MHALDQLARQRRLQRVVARRHAFLGALDRVGVLRVHVGDAVAPGAKFGVARERGGVDRLDALGDQIAPALGRLDETAPARLD